MNSIDEVLNCAKYDVRSSFTEEEVLFVNALTAKSQIVISPAARIGTYALSKLRHMGFNIVGFIDSDISKVGSIVNGIEVHSKENAFVKFKDPIVFIASAVYDSIIREELIKIGYSKTIPFPFLNLKLPNLFISREYYGIQNVLNNNNEHNNIKLAYALLHDSESKNVFINKLLYYINYKKFHLDSIKSFRPIYFDETVYKLNDNEVIVDAGAYNGDTLKTFVNIKYNKYNKYIAFEPDTSNINDLNTLIKNKNYKDVLTICAGLGSENGTAKFLNAGTGDSHIVVDDEINPTAPYYTTINIMKLDDYLESAKDINVTLIKMDIEGAEYDAIKGAIKIITKQTPKLAISAYHSIRDLWQIPLYLSSINPNYKIYLRHYTREIDDTVCYAI